MKVINTIILLSVLVGCGQESVNSRNQVEAELGREAVAGDCLTVEESEGTYVTCSEQPTKFIPVEEPTIKSAALEDLEKEQPAAASKKVQHVEEESVDIQEPEQRTVKLCKKKRIRVVRVEEGERTVETTAWRFCEEMTKEEADELWKNISEDEVEE